MPFSCSTSWKTGLVKKKKKWIEGEKIYIDKCIYVHICIKKSSSPWCFIYPRSSIHLGLSSELNSAGGDISPLSSSPIAEMDESGQLISLGWALFWRKRHRVIYFFHYFCAPMYFTFFFYFFGREKILPMTYGVRGCPPWLYFYGLLNKVIYLVPFFCSP